MQCGRALLLFVIAGAVGWSQPKGIGTAVLAETPLMHLGDETPIEGVGNIRPLKQRLVDTVRALDQDGTRVLLARISTSDLPAARLLLRNIALPPEGNLYIYGRDANGTAGTAYGPFTGAGPLGSGEFWTAGIAGSEIVLELQFSGAIPATPPLDIVGVSLEGSPWPQRVTPASANLSEVRTSWFRGRELTHAIDDGWAIYEGDIILGRADELPDASSRGKSQRRDAVAITGSQYRWTGGIVPYTIDPAITNQTRITTAIDHWNTVMAGHVKLVPRTSETAYVNFIRASSASTCSSMVGRTGYAQTLNVGDYCTSGNLIHEIGHAVGLWHEQGREDRNTFVKILWENIQSGKEYNFNQQITDGDDIAAYNYGSVMHYPANAFSANGLPTIETIPAGIPIGQRSGLNSGDIAAISALYPSAPTSSGTSTVAVTISSNPTGMPIALDGVAAVAPVTINWIPGSVHTISAYNPEAVNATRMKFTKWSDGGASTHQVTVPATAATLRADYATSYLLSTSAAPVGTVTLNPASADQYYTAGTAVQLTAAAPAGYCFASWTGLLPGTANPAALSVNAPSTLVANLQTGTLSVSPVSVASNRDGGTYTLNVSATTGCTWTATSNTDWVKIVSGSAGTGSGSVVVSITGKKGGNKRVADLLIAGVRVSITQQ